MIPKFQPTNPNQLPEGSIKTALQFVAIAYGQVALRGNLDVVWVPRPGETSIPESHLEKLLDAMLAAPEYAMLAALTCPPAGATVAFAGYDAEFEAYLEGSKLRARQIRKAGVK